MEENEYKKRNILIDYTKWLVKWIVILGAGLGVLYGGFLWSEDHLKERKGRLVDAFSIGCDAPPIFVKNHGYNRLYYLFKKRANDKLPSKLYRPPYLLTTITKQTGVYDIAEQYGTLHDSSNARYLVFDNGRRVHRFNRETGQVTYKNLMRDSLSEKSWENCEIITPTEFYERTGKILKKLQEKIKI